MTSKQTTARSLRLDASHRDEHRRWTVGVLVSSTCSRVAAALVSATGHGLDARVELAGAAAAEVPRETTAMFAAMAGGGPCSVTTLAVLRALLADIEASVVDEVLDQVSAAAGNVLAVGVHDPGLWKLSRGGPSGYLGLCDAARVAEATGLNVIDAFPARDLAQGGMGGPVTAVAQWVLLRDRRRSRALLDLGRTVRLTYLPAMDVDSAVSRILSFEVGPGTCLLDTLAYRLTAGQESFDPGGRLAVQGRRLPELISHWLADPYFDHPLPRWHPRGIQPERFLAEALQKAVDSGWSVRDLLCSATHFVAETVSLAIRTRLPEDAQIDEMLIAGGGQHNGMLLGEIARLIDTPMIRVGDLRIPAESLEPASVAVLALLYLDQVPGNSMAISKAEVPRLLGRLTPGSPQSWKRLFQAAGDNVPSLRPLRSAL